MAKLEKMLFIVEQLSGGKRLSLKGIAVDDGWTVFSYNLALCFNFYQQVLWHTDKAEIVFPEGAREEMKRIITTLATKY